MQGIAKFESKKAKKEGDAQLNKNHVILLIFR